MNGEKLVELKQRRKAEIKTPSREILCDQYITEAVPARTAASYPEWGSGSGCLCFWSRVLSQSASYNPSRSPQTDQLGMPWRGESLGASQAEPCFQL